MMMIIIIILMNGNALQSRNEYSPHPGSKKRDKNIHCKICFGCMNTRENLHFI